MSPDVLGQTGSRQGADHISTVRGGLASGSSDQREEAVVGLWHQKRWRQRDTRQRQRQRDRETIQKQDVRADLVSSPHLEQPPAQAAGPTCGSLLDWTLTWPHLLVAACITGHRRNRSLSACLPSLAGRIVHPAAEALLHWWEPILQDSGAVRTSSSLGFLQDSSAGLGLLRSCFCPLSD